MRIPVPVDEAWKALLDIERVAPCVPGATLTGSEGDLHHGTVKVKLGPITLNYTGTVAFTSLDDARRVATMKASGREVRGGGTASAGITCSLVDRGGVTDVLVETDLAVTGKPAQFGRGALNDVAAGLIDRFADNLAAELGPAPQTAEPASAVPSSGSAPVDLLKVGGSVAYRRLGPGVLLLAPLLLLGGVLVARRLIVRLSRKR
jgi:carbon monoxide dehydrogenase subunit G